MASLIVGAGYIGAALAERLCAAGDQVVVLDNGFSTDWSALERLGGRWPALHILRGDVRKRDDIEAAFISASPVATVYLLAAQASAHADAASPEYTEEVNLRGPRMVLDAALTHGAPPVVFGSSFHVYGRPVGQVDETHPYGAFRDLSHLSKVYAEKLGELYANEKGLPFAPVRLGVVYGVGPVTKRDPRFVTVPHAFALRALNGQLLEVHESGLAPIGFVHLQDAVSALIAARPASGYAPANAVSEVLTVVDVARVIERAGALRGLRVLSALPDVAASNPPTFSVTSRLSWAEWTPAHRLEATASDLLAHYASQRVEAV